MLYMTLRTETDVVSMPIGILLNIMKIRSLILTHININIQTFPVLCTYICFYAINEDEDIGCNITLLSPFCDVFFFTFCNLF